MKTGFNPLLFDTGELSLRLIQPGETEIIEQAVEINNDVWGRHLGSTVAEFRSRARYGYLIGAFDSELLVGTISGIGGSTAQLQASRTQPDHPYRTWNGITANGTFTNAQAQPDILFCVAVTTRNRGARPYPDIPSGDSIFLNTARRMARWDDARDASFAKLVQKLAAEIVTFYCGSGLDYVLRFHRRAKGNGFFPGAGLTDILPHGRPADLGAMGYNVIMQYPEVPPLVRLPSRPGSRSIGEALVIAAVYLAARHPTLRFVMPYSRPAQFRENLVKALIAADGHPVGEPRPGFAEFVETTARLTREIMG